MMISLGGISREESFEVSNINVRKCYIWHVGRTIDGDGRVGGESKTGEGAGISTALYSTVYSLQYCTIAGPSSTPPPYEQSTVGFVERSTGARINDEPSSDVMVWQSGCIDTVSLR